MMLLDSNPVLVEGADARAGTSLPALSVADLRRGQSATVVGVVARGKRDAIAQRLGELGFVAGEPVSLLATAPVGRDPIVVQVGFTRFALRRAEAERVRVVAGD